MANGQKKQSYQNELKEIFKNDETFTFREFSCKKDTSIHFCIVFVNGMIDKTSIHAQIIRPIINADLSGEMDTNVLLNTISKETISAASVKESSSLDTIIQELLTGNSVVFVNELDNAIIIDTADWDKRDISEPEAEKTVTGPKEGFTESISTNLVLLRRKLKTKNLKLKSMELGTESKTKVSICYLENIADDRIVKEVEKRLSKINIDGVLDVAYVQEMIKDAPMTPFKVIGVTERPDVVAGRLLEGRIAIFLDGTPVVLTLPFLFVEYFNINEDYYSNFYYASINRIIRWIGFFLASSVPAIYVALITFHQEMVPTQLLLSISGARQNVPFPTMVEAVLMLFVFELLRETSVRMPTVIGQTISIVGALVIGEAAVQAKLISAPMIIVAALTGITSYVVPKMQGEMIITRLIFLLSASFLGLYGYIFAAIGLFVHLASLRSFSIPYMLNVGSMKSTDVKDILIRVPWQKMKTRPRLVAHKNPNRTSEDRKAGGDDENQ